MPKTVDLEYIYSDDFPPSKYTLATRAELESYAVERDRFRKALEKEKETHKSVMKHWLDTNNKMLDKANDHYKGIEEENKKYKKALEEILNSSVSTWGFHEIAREALG